MNNGLETISGYEFVLRAFTMHWLAALVIVGLVAAALLVAKNVNATTRHNLWLLTLLVVLLMPLMVFAPTSGSMSPRFDVFSTVPSEANNRAVLGPDVSSQAVNSDMRQLSGEGANLQERNPIAPPLEATGMSTRPTSGQLQRVESSPQANGQNTVPGAGVDSNAVKSIALSTVVKSVLLFWLVGALLLVRRLWTEYAAARELELQSDSVTPYFERQFTQLCQRLGLSNVPPLRFHAGINAPMTVGLTRVWVAIPMQWREEIDDDIFAQTLTHELGHIARRDPLVNTLQRIMSILFWMYPAVWYICRQLEIERESACDDWVLTHDGKGHAYASNLLDVAESLYLQPQVLAVGCLRSHSQLSRRIQNLLNKSSDHKLRNSWQPLLLTGVGLFTTLSVSAFIWPSASALLDSPTVLSASLKSMPPVSESMGQVEQLANVSVRETRPDAVSDTVLQVESAPMASEFKLPAVAPVPPIEPVGLGGHDLRYSTVTLAGGSRSIAPTIKPGGTTISYIKSRQNIGVLSIARKNNRVSEVTAAPFIDQQLHPMLYAAWQGETDTVVEAVKTKEVDVDQSFDRIAMPQTLMQAAILQGHEKLAKKLIALGANLDTEGKNEVSLLTVAAIVGRNSMTALLLKHDAEPDQETVSVAVQNRNRSMVQMLLRAGAKPSSDTLVLAVVNRDTRMVDTLLKQSDCDCLKTDEALLVAVQNRDVQSARLLAQTGADIEDQAIAIAVHNRDLAMVRELLRYLDDGDIADEVINAAVHSKDVALLDTLLNSGAKPDDTAVMLAVQNQDVAMLNRLLKSDAKAGEAALVLALQSQDAALIDLLLEAGAKPGDGALVMALQFGDIHRVRQLLRSGAEPEEGALISAIQTGNAGLVKMMLQHDAEIGENAYLFAEQTDNSEILQLLDQYSTKAQQRQFESARKNRKAYEVAAKYQNKRSRLQRSLAEHQRAFPLTIWPTEAQEISLGFDESSRQFGGNKKHQAWDIPSKSGAPIYAVANGVVVKAGFSEGYGNYVVLDHGDGYFTKYANNASNRVSEGDVIKAGEIIATVGESATDKAKPHLHFEVKFNGHRVDPAMFYDR